MNRHALALCLIIFAPVPLTTAIGAEAVAQSTIVERGLDHRVHERVTEQQVASGKVIQRKSRVTELATGMHRIVDGQYVECRNTIELLNGHAVAQQTRLPVIFAASPNAAAAIDSEAPDGKRLRCNVLGLALYDPSNGNNLMINEVHEAVGELHPPNRVYYPAALAGTSPEFPACDLLYTVELSGWEQFVLIRNKFSLPPGFNPETTRLECWTEFLTPPTPLKHVRTIHRMTDENLDFGAVTIGPGKAFMLGANEWSTPVAKTWIQTAGRFFLVEAVPWKTIEPSLERLPPPGQAALRRNTQMARISKERIIPAPRRASKTASPMRMAAVPLPESGLVLDFAPVLTTNSMTLEGDKQYLVSSAVIITNLTIEGGCIVRFTNGSKIEVALPGSLTCKTSPYRPAIFTSVFDSTVGSEFATNRGPANTDCDTVLVLHDSTAHALDHVRMSYALKGISLDEGTVTMKNSTFSHIAKPLYGTSQVNFKLLNGLVYDASYVIEGGAASVLFEHVTCNDIDYFSGIGIPSVPYYLTNCILADLGYWGTGTYYTNAVVTNLASGVFQTVGGCAHYLVDNSPYRDAGVSTTAIASEIRSKTTYPPVVYPYFSLIVNADLTLTPQAERDIATPDLGWHPEPLDFVFGPTFVTNATVYIKAGTVVGFYSTAPNGYGFGFDHGGRLIAEGSPTNLVRLVRYSTVQEIANTNWAGSTTAPLILTPWDNAIPPPEFRFRFVDFAVLADEATHIHGYQFITNMPAISVADCQFRGGKLYTEGPSLSFTNCFFERVNTMMYTYDTWPFTNRFQNNLFYGGEVQAYTIVTTNEFTFSDNLFDKTILSNSTDVANSYNGYLTGYNRLSPSGSTDVILTNISYQTGPLSRFYLPTNSPLVNTGSVNNAALKGMYWHSSFTNGTWEGTSPLNIGLMFIAVTNGVAADTDGEGLANYIEDANGNGTQDSTESNWNTGYADTDTDGVDDYIEYLQGRNPLATWSADTNVVINLRAFTPLR